MGGGYISCGTFLGEDKSGSALEGVLDALPVDAHALVCAIKDQLDEAQHVILEIEQAADFLPFLESYRQNLVTELGHDDPDRVTQAEIEAGADFSDLKWGTG